MRKFLTLQVYCLALFGGAGATGAESLSLASWNVHGGQNPVEIRREISSTDLKNTTFFHLQEAPSGDSTNFAKAIGLEFSFYVHSAGYDSILSKYPFSNVGELLINPLTGRNSAWAEVTLPNGITIRLYTQHLSYKVAKSPLIAKIRAQEMSVILAHARDFSGPILIGGDLNTVGKFLFGHSSEPTIKLLKKEKFQDALQTVGGRTHKWAGRVDWIFYKELSLVSAERGAFGGSDHRWIRANFILN